LSGDVELDRLGIADQLELREPRIRWCAASARRSRFARPPSRARARRRGRCRCRRR
jgi:hypothetical protein